MDISLFSRILSSWTHQEAHFETSHGSVSSRYRDHADMAPYVLRPDPLSCLLTMHIGGIWLFSLLYPNLLCLLDDIPTGMNVLCGSRTSITNLEYRYMRLIHQPPINRWSGNRYVQLGECTTRSNHACCTSFVLNILCIALRLMMPPVGRFLLPSTS